MGKNAKPRIRLLALGGTIAGCGEDPFHITGYKAGVLSAEALLETLPDVGAFAEITAESFAAIDSKDMTEELLLGLSGRVNELLAGETEGIVVTGGTDTLEETAYFLQLTVKSAKPVVITGAMRPTTASYSDGSLNLLHALCLAASSEAAGKGVLVCLNEQIHSARFVTKTHTTSINAFQSPDFGLLGIMAEERPKFYTEARRRHTLASEFAKGEPSFLPCVRILYGHAGDDGFFVRAAVSGGAEGIVYAGMGNGSIHQEAEKELKCAAKSGVAVVRSKRCQKGAVMGAEKSYTEAGFINGGDLNPQKCRLLLMLALTKTKDPSEIQRIFDEY